MNPVLLDVNVLIALLWPAHEHHSAAHQWFGKNKARRWATCPLTELAFVRIVSNPAFSDDALTPSDALSLLEQNLAHPLHLFWPDDIPVRRSVLGEIGPIEGHRQIADRYLMVLAKKHEGALATLDQKLKTAGPLIELIHTKGATFRPGRRPF